jgi:hypothetical protein
MLKMLKLNEMKLQWVIKREPDCHPKPWGKGGGFLMFTLWTFSQSIYTYYTRF